MSNLPGFTAEQSLRTPFNSYSGLLRPDRSMTINGISVNSVEPALPITTDDCLGQGLCAYVSPKGRVTCGPCPAPPRLAWAVNEGWLFHPLQF